MSGSRQQDTDGADGQDSGLGAAGGPDGVSPYATGGGGVTFERRVATLFLSHLLAGDGALGLGDGLRVVSVAFQQAPAYPLDDLVVTAARSGETEPSLVLALAVRRSPKLVASNDEARQLIGQFVQAATDVRASGPEHRWGLVVAGPQKHAEQLARLAGLASGQMDAPGFFALVHTPRKFDSGLRGRLDQLERLVEHALVDSGEAEPVRERVRQVAWQLLSGLTVLMPRLESPDESDWNEVANRLVRVARGSELTGALGLRDRLFALASEYAPQASRVNFVLLRSRVHELLEAGVRPHDRGWRTLDHLHERALTSVSDKITYGDRRVSLNRDDAASELLETATTAGAVIVVGESGVGKSALAVPSLAAAAAADPDTVQVLCINLRDVHPLSLDFESALGCPLSVLLGELSAPHRLLVVDSADDVTEDKEAAFRYIVDAAHASDVRVVAITAIDSHRDVRDTLARHFGTDIREYEVPPLTDSEIDEIAEVFTELDNLKAIPRSRELLRRLVVVGLLVRSEIAGVPLTDADAMTEVWTRLVRRRRRSDRGTPEAREWALLRLADYALRGGSPLEAVSGIDHAALDDLRRNGLLRATGDDPFVIVPEFAHDEVRRYAVARLLLANRTPAEVLLDAGAPRWSLAAAQLACQALLAESDTTGNRVRGRFVALQASFDELVVAGHGERWGDVPGEALLSLPNPDEVLRDAWPDLSPDDPGGRSRFARLIDQRFRDQNRLVKVTAVEPIIELLLQEATPWWRDQHAQELLRDWLRAHVFADTSPGHGLRVQLRQRLVEACAEADRSLADLQRASAAPVAPTPEQVRQLLERVRQGNVTDRIPEEVEHESQLPANLDALSAASVHDGDGRRQRPEIPWEITDRIVVELLALLGPDLGDDGETILLRVAQDAPHELSHAVEEPFAARALAAYRPEFLAAMTEAYYLDDEIDDLDDTGNLDGGIRRHTVGPPLPLAGWYRGPFAVLLRTDFRIGVGVLNRMLNHAATVRAHRAAIRHPVTSLTGIDQVDHYRVDLEISGQRRSYSGDGQVWCWYRGTGGGPYPCLSGLLALERLCDHLIKAGAPIRVVVSALLDGCENLAMVGLVVGLLVRHLQDADDLLDPYLAEPLIWHYEFSRVVRESSPLVAGSEGLTAPERRRWEPRDAAAFMVLNADDDRAARLQALGETLVANARRQLESTHNSQQIETEDDFREVLDEQLMVVRGWAASLDRDRYSDHEDDHGRYIQMTPPEDVSQALQGTNDDLQRAQLSLQLKDRYYIQSKVDPTIRVEHGQLISDIAVARELLENPSPFDAHHYWDAPALVAVAALEAHLLYGLGLPDDDLAFAASTVLRIAEGEAEPPQFDSDYMFLEWGASRSAARALPLLLLPVAVSLRPIFDATDESIAVERVTSGGISLARSVSNEVRLHLARGLDRIWTTPCVQSSCHHEEGLRLVIESMHECLIGDWNPETVRCGRQSLKEPIAESLSDTPDRSIIPSQLDAAIRALAPAAAADICISTKARDLLVVVLAAQQRGLLAHGRSVDHHGTSSLVSARALLILAGHGEDGLICGHIDTYASSPGLLDNLLRALSATAEESSARAATAKRIWPGVVRRVLEFNEQGQALFEDRYSAERALAALIPNSTAENAYIYREVEDNPLRWWQPLEMQAEIEAWLVPARGIPNCVDQLLSFLGVLETEERVQIGLPWVEDLVLADPGRVARRTDILVGWLIEGRSAAVDAGLLDVWQRIVDALVVAGESQLAPYSE